MTTMPFMSCQEFSKTSHMSYFHEEQNKEKLFFQTLKFSTSFPPQPSAVLVTLEIDETTNNVTESASFQASSTGGGGAAGDWHDLG
jgi:hypothetical protein